jgi:hypothetical protein
MAEGPSASEITGQSPVIVKPDGGNLLFRVTRGKFGRASVTHLGEPTIVEPKVEEPPVVTKRPLSPDAEAAKRNLQALIGGYESSSLEEQARILEELKTGGPGTVSERAIQAGAISDTLGVSREQGVHYLGSLEKAKEQVPAVGNLISMLDEPLLSRHEVKIERGPDKYQKFPSSFPDSVLKPVTPASPQEAKK